MAILLAPVSLQGSRGAEGQRSGTYPVPTRSNLAVQYDRVFSVRRRA